MLKAVAQADLALGHADPSFKKDHDVVLKAVAQAGQAQAAQAAATAT